MQAFSSWSVPACWAKVSVDRLKSIARGSRFFSFAFPSFWSTGPTAVEGSNAALLHDHRMVAACLWGGTPQQEHERNGAQREDHHQFEVVDVADDGSLVLDDLIERGPPRGGPWAPRVRDDAV